MVETSFRKEFIINMKVMTRHPTRLRVEREFLAGGWRGVRGRVPTHQYQQPSHKKVMTVIVNSLQRYTFFEKDMRHFTC